MLRTTFITLLFASTAFAADGPVDRWAAAVGGRQKVAAIKSIYREGTLQFGGMQGSIKVWHAAEGRYRKEEQVAAFSSVETFDGAKATLQRGGGDPQTLAGADLAMARSKAYANSNAMFYAFFPERRHGTLTVVDDHTIAFTPEGGVEWRVTLDPQSGLPKTMVHSEGDRTITVEFVSYETVDGVTLEKEIHRSMGDPRFDSVIRFTETVLNPPDFAEGFQAHP